MLEGDSFDTIRAFFRDKKTRSNRFEGTAVALQLHRLCLRLFFWSRPYLPSHTWFSVRQPRVEPPCAETSMFFDVCEKEPIGPGEAAVAMKELFLNSENTATRPAASLQPSFAH